MKVALIAMSGVRAHNEELTRLGLTLPGFVERSKVIASLPSLGLLTLAGMTPDRFEISYHEVADINAVEELPECDLAAFSTFTAQAVAARSLSARYRTAGIPTVLGGLHATAVPHDELQYYDAVAVGEGEIIWPEILRDAERGCLSGIYWSFGREFDLADAPTPRFDLLDTDRYNRLTVQTQRGCPWRCEFCASSIMLTPRYKLKPVAKVIEEIRAIKQIWAHPFIEFADDNSFVNKRHARELIRAVGEEGVHWFTETDISLAEDDELLSLMKDSGCAQVLIGLESPTPGGIDGVERRRNWKSGQREHYREAIERIQSHGIAVNSCFVLGLDGDTTAVFDEVARFVEESGVFTAQITVETPFPGTELYTRLKSEQRLLYDGEWERFTLFDVNFEPKQMSVDDLERGLRELGLRLYSEEATKARKRAFLGQRRARRRQLQAASA